MPKKCYSDGDGIKVGEDAPAGPKQVLSTLPQGAYTSCRSIGGWKSESTILMFDFHIRRLEESLQWLFPTINFSNATFEKETETPQTVQGTHPNVGNVVHEEVQIFFAGEKDSVGLNVSEEAAKNLRDRIGVGSLVNMRGISLESILSPPPPGASKTRFLVFILECDGEGQATFGAAKILRLLAKEAQSQDAKTRLASTKAMVLGIAKSNCSFSSASLGDGKYAAARKLDDALGKLGASKVSELQTLDAEMQDLRGEIEPWATKLQSALEQRDATPFSTALQQQVSARVSSALRGGADEEEAEAMVVVVCYPVQSEGAAVLVKVAAFAAPLPTPALSASVEVLGGPRETPRAKDSSWAEQRAPIEAAMSSSTSEALLADKDGKVLLEGLITNIFVIDADGTILTAGEGVLIGHMRALVVHVCVEQGLPLRLECPRLDQMDRWQGAFLCSTTRPVQPITEIRCPHLPNAPTKTFQDLGPVQKLKDVLSEAVPGLIRTSS